MKWRNLFGWLRLTPVRVRSVRTRNAAFRLETLEDRTALSGGLVNNLVVFGDSLADTGNLSLATGGTIPNASLYYQGRFSNGPIWVDTLAKYLGKPAVQPSLAGGLDYAFGGATVADTTPPPPFNQIPMLSVQVGQYLSSHTPGARDLIAVWAGANDFIDTFTSPTGPINPNLSADALKTSLQTLATAGARRFVVPNLPPLGETPFLQELSAFFPGLSAAADQWTAAFNTELGKDLGQLASANHGVTVVPVDVAGLFQQITQPSNPFGFVNTTSAVGPLLPGSVFLSAITATDPQDYLFFDGVHPTSKGHQLVGLEAAAGVYTALGVHHLAVTSTADTVDPTASGLSLREMLNLSNAMTGQETITFNLGVAPQSIQLTGKDLAITQNLILEGPMNQSLTLNGEGASRLFEVAANAHVTISDLTLLDGKADQGGAISNAGALRLEDLTLLDNAAQLGGAIYNTGTLQVEGGRLAWNSAVGSALAAGGALANSGPAANASLFATLIDDNTVQGGTLAEGGGIANLGGARLNVAFSVLVDNRVAGVEARGGGIFNGATSALYLSSSLLISNAAYGNATAGGHGFGGGLYLAAGSQAEIDDTWILGNFASTQGSNVYLGA